MKDKRLLILGSVEDFTGLTKYAVERGIYTIVVDAYPGEAKKYASKSYYVSLDDEDLIDCICKYEKADHILSSFSDNLFEKMVYASERNQLPCFCSSKKVRFLRDKILMKNMLRELGIKTANGQILEMDKLNAEAIEILYPCVIKPLDGWGSKGMKIVHNFSELKEFVAESVRYSTSGQKAMLEEINSGYEINVMSWIREGKAFLIELGDRETSGATDKRLPYVSREVFPTYFYKEIKEQVIDYFQRIAAYIGLKEGPLSMQFFYNNGEITIGEVAGRFFGLGQGIVPVINGIDPNKLLINSLYFPEENEKILQNAGSDLDHYSVAIYLKAKRGIVRDLGNVEIFEKECVDEFRVFAQVGESTTSIPWLIRIYAHFSNRKEADAFTDDVYSHLYIPDLNGENLVAPNRIVEYIKGC